MVDIKVNTKNIGGLDKFSAKLTTGKVNIVKGSSSSGKSSLMRGIHLGLVGSGNKYTDEIENLRLDDTKTDQALLRRGQSEGSVEIDLGNKKMETTISKNGMIKGKNSNEKSVFTTMLSALPPTKLHQNVMNPSVDDPDNFDWVLDDLSEAGYYLSWYKVLNSLDQETATLRIKFNKWKNDLQGSSAKRDEINSKLEKLIEQQMNRAKGSAVEAKELGSKLSTAEIKFATNMNNYNEFYGKLEDSKSENEAQIRRIDAANRDLRMNQNRLDEAEDSLENQPIEPDMKKYDSAIEKADAKVRRMTGSLNDPKIKKVGDTFLKDEKSIIKASNEHGNAMYSLLEEVGDEGYQEAVMELQEAKSNRDKVVRDYMDRRRKYGSAEDQAAAARSGIASARATISAAKTASTVSDFTMMEESVRRSKQDYQASEKEVIDLREQMSRLDDSPEAKKAEQERRSLESERDSLETSTVFEIRFSSLQMLPNETLRLSLKQAEELLGSEDDKPQIDFVKTYLTDSQPEVRSRIKQIIEDGFLAQISATSKWTEQEADKQRQETRRIFNEVGTTLFGRLKMSPISSVTLDTDYQLKISWSDGSTTGLTGAGGERTIIAAALLIAMRKAYSPEIPILMFDDITDKLDPRPRKEFLDFLSEYAKTEDVAVIVSELDSSFSTAKVSIR